MLHGSRPWPQRVVLLVIAVGCVWTAAVAVSGGVVVHLLGLRISAHGAARPLLAGAIGVALYVALYRRHWREDIAILARPFWPTTVAALLALLAIPIGMSRGLLMGGGPDPSGYVSQADMWARGHLTLPMPEWAVNSHWINGNQSGAPVGWRPQASVEALAPVYSPGLPLTMALFQLVGGRDAVFYVVPLFGALAVWATYLLGNRMAGPWAGAIAAILLMCSPVFLSYLLQPMSDLPVTACLTAALVFAWRPSPTSAAWTGMATAAAILIRPNLVPLAIVNAVLIATTRERRVRRLMLFAVPTAVAMLAIATLNWYWNGSPLESGYGSLDSLYSPTRIWPNLMQYGAWLVDAQTPLILLGLAAPLVLRRDRIERERLVVTTVVYPLGVFAMYIAYLSFDRWDYLRFLLPAFPALLAGLAALLIEFVRDVRRPAVAMAAVAVITASLALQEWRFAVHAGVPTLRDNQERFARAVDFANATPKNAILVSNAYSGTLHFYTGRDVLRWEVLVRHQFDEVLASLRAQGHPLYFFGDEFELKAFKKTFPDARTVKDLDRRLIEAPEEQFVMYDLTTP